MADLRAEAVRRLTVLGLRPGAAWPEVHDAYRTLAQVWHPDRFAAGSRIQGRAGQRQQVINEAYAWLSDHRQVLAALKERPAAGEPATPGRAPRTPHVSSSDRARGLRRARPMPVLDSPRRQPMWVWGAAGAVALVAFVSALALGDRGPEMANSAVREPLARTDSSFAVARRAEAREVYIEAREMHVTADRLNVRTAPTTASAIVDSVFAGDRVRVDAAQGAWRRIVGGEPLRVIGWVHADYLTPAPTPRASTPASSRETSRP